MIRQRSQNPLQFIVGFAVMIMVFVGLFYIARGVFNILSFVAPVLFIITLLLRRHVVINYVKSLVQLTKQNPILGILAIVLSVVAFPIVSFLLFGRAILNWKADTIRAKEERMREDEYVSYEIVEEDLDLEDIPQKEKVKHGRESDIDSFFE